jgi:drug/metabolite transporter (DMT)-like permease
MSQLLALSSAALYGIADFSGGLASRSMRSVGVAAWSQFLGVPLLILGALVIPFEDVDRVDVAYGALGGVFGIIGVVALYGALAAGTMSLVSPLTGVLTAVIPVVWGVTAGEAIIGRQWLGIALALVAVALIAANGGSTRLGSGVLVRALVASLGFAAFFIALDQTSEGAGMWPLVAGRAVSIPLALGVAAVTASGAFPQRRVLPTVAVAGNADVAANLAVLGALQTGPLGISVVLTSLYPAFTALAAVAVVRERPTVRQTFGIVLALAAAVLLVV